MVKKQKDENFLIGTSGWCYDDWREKFYPTTLAKSAWLSFYMKNFNTVELNATFYRLFKDATYVNWKNQAIPNFKYVVKIPRFITHQKHLLNCENDIKKFCDSTDLLEDKLGLLLLQLPPAIPYDLKRLKNILLSFKEKEKIVIEFRNHRWLTPAVKNLLTEMQCIFCITDSPIISLNDWLTSDIAYIRLHGHTHWFDYNYSEFELNNIAKLALKLKTAGAKKIYIFFNNAYHTNAIQNAKFLKNILENN